MIEHPAQDLATIVRASPWPERTLENMRATLLGTVTTEAFEHVGPASTFEHEQALIGSVCDLLATYGLGTDALTKAYVEPIARVDGFSSENRTRIAHAQRGITLTRFVPEEHGYVFEAQTCVSNGKPIILYSASPKPIERTQYHPSMRVEWINDLANDDSIARRQRRTYKQSLRRIDAAVRYAI